MSKLEALSDPLATALRARRVPALQAALATQIGIAAFAHATLAWLENEEPELGEGLDLTQQALKSLFQ